MISKEQSVNLDNYLTSRSDLWGSVPDYGTFSEHDVLARMQELRDGIVKETDSPVDQVDAAHAKTAEFVNEAFKGQDVEDLGRVFMVTRRANRNDQDEYASESRYHFPLAVPEFGVSPNIRMRSQVGLPPFAADFYTNSDKQSERGAVVIAPLYADMMTDLDKNKRAEIGYRNLARSVELAHSFGADVIGLGALLPKMTYFGKVLSTMDRADIRTTTTGHGGTIHLISETVKKVLERPSIDRGFKGQVGVLGAVGSIGHSTVATILSEMPDVRIHAYDTKEELSRLPSENKRISLANNPIDLLKSNNVIVSAITEIIDLDVLDPNKKLDLTGKVIIDDSQPGCFHRDQVELRGGKIIWVAGKDTSENRFMTRDGRYTGGPGKGYNYGDSSGLYGPSTEFGCGIELAALTSTGEVEKAIKAPVTPRDAKVIGELFRRTGAIVAEFQSFGQPVEIE